MYRILVLFTSLSLSFAGLSQTCLPEGITFTTQAQIDSFQINYPDCHTIIGDVKIRGPVTNLNGLNTLSTIEGELEIRLCDRLKNLSGLNNLESIGNRIFLIFNDSLINLTGLESLQSIGNGLWIWHCNNLSSLAGLDNLISSGVLFIYFNDVLSDITALNNLVSVESILFTANPSLTNLNGLNNLTSCTGIQLDLNDSLIDISALENITNVNNGLVRFYSNQSLTSLTGLDNIIGSSIGDLLIWDNFNLNVCGVQSICDYLSNPDAESDIHDNASGCNSRAEVESACGVGIVDNPVALNQLTIIPNPSSTTITLGLPMTFSTSTLSIYNLNAQQVISGRITEPQTVVDISFLPQGIYFVHVTHASMILGTKFLKF
jgi:hypothetical protein